VAAKLEQERRMRESISGHKTGLPRKLLELFNPLPPVEPKQPVHRRKPKLPYTGIGQYVELFAAPGALRPPPPPPPRWQKP
jgi:U1 small nuclear ribonucleoprotein